MFTGSFSTWGRSLTWLVAGQVSDLPHVLKPLASPWLGIGLVLAVLAGLFGVLRLYQRLGSPHPELVRKLLHVSMGLVTLTFPWLFDTAWPVLLLAGLSIAGLLALRLLGGLREGLGHVVSGVGRLSLGEIYFPLAVTVLFLLFLNQPPDPPERRLMLYCIPVLLLTLADAAAALIGISYGRLHYHTVDGVKSAEGSLAFFLCAFFVIHVPLLLFTDTGRAETLLIAVLLAWLATLFEAIAWHGLDNLVLPLVSFLLLKIYLALPVHELTARLGITAILVVFLALYRRRATLEGSAVLGAFLIGYIAWALCGWHWVVAPLVLFVTYTFLSPKTETNSRQIHSVHAVLSVCAAGMVWLFLAVIFDRPELLYLYTLAFAAQLAIIGIARLKFDYPRMSDARLPAVCVSRGWLVLFVPYLVAEGPTVERLTYALLGVVGVAAAALAFYGTQPDLHDCPTDTPRWIRQGTHAALGSALGLVPLYLL